MGAATSGQSVMTARDYGPRHVRRQKFQGRKTRFQRGAPDLPSMTDTTRMPDTLVGCF
jgi:hypothetical protein